MWIMWAISRRELPLPIHKMNTTQLSTVLLGTATPPHVPVGCILSKNRFFVTQAKMNDKHVPFFVLAGREVSLGDRPAP